MAKCSKDFDYLKANQLFFYRHGYLFNRVRPTNSGKYWDLSYVGEETSLGLVYVNSFGGEYFVDRTIWTINNNNIPRGFDVAHKDNDLLNNNISNLELKVALPTSYFHSVFVYNDSLRVGFDIDKYLKTAKVSPKQKLTPIKQLGSVSQLTKTKKWKADIVVDGVKLHIGSCFDSEENGRKAIELKKIELGFVSCLEVICG